MPFSIDINYLDEVTSKWDESKHKRGQPGNAGQFGSGGGGSPQMPDKKVNIESFVAKHIQSGKSLPELVEKLKIATVLHVNKGYVAKILAKAEKTHNLPKGSLSGKGGVPFQAPPVKPEPAPVASYKQKSPGIQQIDDIINNAVNPVHAAVAIKKLSGANAAPEVQEHAKAVFADLVKYNPSKEKELNQVWGVEKPKLPDNYEFPKPHETSVHQVAIYEIAQKAYLAGTEAEGVAQIKAYPTVVQYPEGFTAKYANELIVGLGGEPIAQAVSSTPTPIPSAPKPTIPIAVLKPSNPSKSWLVAQQRFEAAYKPKRVNSWDQTAAEQCFASASNVAWASLEKESGGKLNSAVMSYGGSGYDGINGALRDDTGVGKDYIEQAVTIDNAFSEPEAEILKDTVIMRGTNLTAAFVDKLKNGLKTNKPTRFPLDGFSSCSFSKEPAFGSKPYWLEIVATKGIPLLSAAGNAVGTGEREVLLRHGQNYEVLEIEENYQTSNGKKTRIRCITV